MRIAFVSDTHEMHDAVEIPACDVLVHCGDFTNRGERDAVARFAAWIADRLDDGSARGAIVIGGNHDLSLDRGRPESRARDEVLAALERAGAMYLEDDGCEVEGVRFHGSPWTPRFFDWAFMVDDEREDRARWAPLPSGIDVLVTHGPPLGILDRTYDGRAAGSPALRDAVLRARPRLHAFGHIHEGYGIAVADGTTFVNASSCTLRYEPTNPAIVIDLL